MSERPTQNEIDEAICKSCVGTGVTDAGIHKTVHTHYSVCNNCKGSGKANSSHAQDVEEHEVLRLAYDEIGGFADVPKSAIIILANLLRAKDAAIIAQLKQQNTLLNGVFSREEELQAQLSKFQTSEFNPDWSMLQASQESLREHMRIIADLKAQLAEAELRSPESNIDQAQRIR